MNVQKNGNIKISLIACKIFQSLLATKLSESLTESVHYLDYGYHATPKKLKQEIQLIIDQFSDPRLIVLGYGLCGNGLVGVKSRKHTLLIPKTDDCIAVLLGSYDIFLNVFTSEPGTYYLTKGWLEAGSNPLQEYQDILRQYGQEKAEIIMDMQYKNYQRLMFIAHQEEDFDVYKEQTQEIANFCRRWDMKYEERIGSDEYIQKLIMMMSRWGQKNQEAISEELRQDFVIVHPHDEIQQSHFWR